MTVFKIIDAFTFYGVDVMLLAAVTALLTQLLKLTLFRRAKKKLCTLMPFALGTLLYAAFAAARNLSLCYIIDEYVSVLEHGTSVGATATLYYVLYEQFIRERNELSASESVIATLIEGYVPESEIQSAAKAVAEAIERDVTGGGARRAEEILSAYAEGETEADVRLLSRLIIETLAHLNR